MLAALRQRLGHWLLSGLSGAEAAGARRAHGLDAGPDSAPDRAAAIERRLHLIEERLRIAEHFDQGGRATYVGNGLVLVKCVVRGVQIVYLVHGDDRLLSPWFIASGAYETELTEFFVRTLRPDDRCLDVGANFGYFTCLFARFAPSGRVLGIEPEPATFTLLRDNIHANGLAGLAEAVHAAVTDRRGPVTLHRRVRRAGNTSITAPNPDFVRKLGEPPSESFEIKGVILDRLADKFEGRVDVMKVDVEGAEPLVFRGARETIARNPRIQIVMEWSPGQIRGAGFDAGVFLGELEAMGLRFFDLEGGTPKALGREALLALDYRGGVLLAREPR
ncbi:FkbM family methyltransferase [Falsiroseomonas sp. HW251]|uniref:FkbM family methyltransferase n=1 Tax=Falsiroseomonas sp. HW251 TaxID=3390998 RepID=UPI003D314356